MVRRRGPIPPRNLIFLEVGDNLITYRLVEIIIAVLEDKRLVFLAKDSTTFVTLEDIR